MAEGTLRLGAALRLGCPFEALAKCGFTDADFDWDKHTQRDKTAIIKAVNRIHREDPRCKEHIYPSLVGRSADETKKRGKPVYFVNCGFAAPRP